MSSDYAQQILEGIRVLQQGQSELKNTLSSLEDNMDRMERGQIQREKAFNRLSFRFGERIRTVEEQAMIARASQNTLKGRWLAISSRMDTLEENIEVVDRSTQDLSARIKRLEDHQ